MPKRALPDQDLRRSLARLDRNIVQTDLLISRQIARIERMTETGDDTARSRGVLHGLEQVLGYWHAQREIMLDTDHQWFESGEPARRLH